MKSRGGSPSAVRKIWNRLADLYWAALSARPTLPLAAAAFAAVVFVIDAFTTLEYAIAVVYSIVVLISAVFLNRTGVIVVAGTCAALTVLGYAATHDVQADAALVRCLVSLMAIAIATILALMNQSAHATLREQARLLDLTHDAIFVRRMDDVIIYWNRGAEELYGWRSEEAVGRVSHDLLQTAFPLERALITSDLVASNRWDGELVQRTRDGTRVVVSSRWSMERDKHGAPLGILESNTDITERKRAQESLDETRAELAHVSRLTVLGELSASIAHEVNQPLAAIVLNAGATRNYLEHDPPRLDDARRVAERVIQSADRATSVIQRIRGLSKRTPGERIPTVVDEVVSETVPLLRSQAVSQQVALKLELEPDLPPALADRIQVQQVIINLIVNAIDAVKVTSGRVRQLKIQAREYDPDHVLVSVEDNGIGIDPEKAQRLFDPFFTTKPDGMGMGLSICRSIVESHGGRIWASANAGPGATIQFTLPKAVANPAEGRATADLAAAERPLA